MPNIDSPVTSVTAVRTDPPAWLVKYLAAIDGKRFGDEFEIFAEDVEAHFGVFNWKGREEVRSHLVDFDNDKETHHEIHEFWDAGNVKFFRGTIDVTDPATGETVHSHLVHFWHMDPDRPDKVATVFAAVGPLGNL